MEDARTAVQAFANMDSALDVVAGDFNVSYNPPASSMPTAFLAWFFTHDEAWTPTKRVTFNTGTMIDYEWVDRDRMRQNYLSPCVDYAYSDHRICPGRFLLT
jgi:hypothetical protein